MSDLSFALPAIDTALTASRRADGWSPERQRAFLEAIADGRSAEQACQAVGLSVASAYAFRRRAAGAAFALGWRAALLVARDVVADRLMARALDGQEESWTRADGSVGSRHRFDNRLAMALLARLDRLAEAPPAAAQPAGNAAIQQAERLIAQDFDAFLHLVETEANPARAALFVAARAPQRPQHSHAVGYDEEECPDEEEEEEEEERAPVWRNSRREWRTVFAPPPGETVREYGRFGSADYYRQLTQREPAIAEAREAAEAAHEIAASSAERDAWFGVAAADGRGDGLPCPSSSSSPPT